MAGIINCGEIAPCEDTCPIYDLCEVTIKATDSKGRCLPDSETRIICEGFKFSSKLDVEVKTNSACYEAYGYQVSNMQYDWEITNPCDRDWFDKRFVAQVCDKYSMEITGYVQENCGEWVAKETLKACIIEETGRDYGKGVTRSIKGKALHRIIHDGKTDDNGYTSNSDKSYRDSIAEAFIRSGLGVAGDLVYDDEYELLREGFLHTVEDVKHLSQDVLNAPKFAITALNNAVFK